jgi:hypothetical protein
VTEAPEPVSSRQDHIVTSPQPLSCWCDFLPPSDTQAPLIPVMLTSYQSGFADTLQTAWALEVGVTVTVTSGKVVIEVETGIVGLGDGTEEDWATFSDSEAPGFQPGIGWTSFAGTLPSSDVGPATTPACSRMHSSAPVSRYVVR